jgi:hypothetical protein
MPWRLAATLPGGLIAADLNCLLHASFKALRSKW